MPYLHIRTSAAALEEGQQRALLSSASAMVAKQLNKPESYVMVALDSSRAMSFGGSMDPCAYVKLISLGLEPDQCPELSKALCTFIKKQLGVPANRVYIEFRSPDRKLFAWDGKTF